jgi:hypothetical protein
MRFVWIGLPGSAANLIQDAGWAEASINGGTLFEGFA